MLFVGRLQARKRVDILLRACAALPVEKQPHLIIIGEGPEEERLHRLAASLYPQAEFTGARHGPDLDPYFRLADLFVLPGTGGLAVQQAMSYGLPVIVAEADGTQEDLVRPENGWRVPPGNQAALVEAINSALSDPLRLRVMGAASHRIVREEANLEKMRTVFLYTLETVTRMKTKYPTGKTR